MNSSVYYKIPVNNSAHTPRNLSLNSFGILSFNYVIFGLILFFARH